MFEINKANKNGSPQNGLIIEETSTKRRKNNAGRDNSQIFRILEMKRKSDAMAASFGISGVVDAVFILWGIDYAVKIFNCTELSK